MSVETSWIDPARYVQQIHVERGCLDFEYTQEILNRSKLPFSIIEDREHPQGIEGEYPYNMTQGKKHLVLAQNRGGFFKACPATREYRCCDYNVLNIGMNCPMDCVYCILQAYLNNPWLSFFVNVEQMFQEIDDVFTARGTEFFRIGTGEFTDSLGLDSLTHLSKKLIHYMADKKRGVLELKTKSGVIDNLEGLEHNGRTIVAWSLNSTEVMEKEEFRVATLDERLVAAKKCADWGYKLAFHFDPVVIHKNWEEGYRKTIERLFEVVPKEKIAWISIGALRFLPDLKKIGNIRFPKSRMYFQEFITGLDGKSRYFRSERVTLYNHIYKELQKRVSEQTCVYFCMESDEIWQEVMGFVPESRGGVPGMLDRAVFG